MLGLIQIISISLITSINYLRQKQMANNKVRVDIPKNATLLLALSERIFAKHNEMALTSPLNSMQNHKWEVNGPEVAKALALHQQAEDLQRGIFPSEFRSVPKIRLVLNS